MIEAHKPDLPDQEPPDLRHCCLQSAALDEVPVPLAVYDEEQVLIANRACARIFAGGRDMRGLHIDTFLQSQTLPSAHERRRALLDRGMSIDNVTISAKSLDAGTLCVRQSLERVEYGNGRRAILATAHQVGETNYFEYTPKTRFGRRKPPKPGSCLPEAVFEALPFPALVTDGREVIAANLQARLTFTSGEALVGRKSIDIVHPHSLDAARQRRSMLFSAAQGLRNVVVKLNGADGELAALTDLVSFEHAGALHSLVAIREVNVAD